MQQKTEQLSLPFSDRGEARKHWKSGRLVSSADRPEKSLLPAPTLAEGLIEAMVTGKGPETALRKVEANKGAPGVDGMGTEELRPYLVKHWKALRQALLDGRYQPRPSKAGRDT